MDGGAIANWDGGCVYGETVLKPLEDGGGKGETGPAGFLCGAGGGAKVVPCGPDPAPTVCK